MKDNVLEIRLWDETVGFLSWDEKRSTSIFQFDKDFARHNWNVAPLLAPLDSSYVQNGFPLLGNKEKLYCGLPEFIADSLPDYWGNVVFQKWMESSKLQDNQITAVDRLAFMEKRAMGALEFRPAHVEADASVNVELSSLYELADKIFNDRQNVTLDIKNSLVMEDMYKVGTSAGGQRPKAIIAIDNSTGIVRSGQAELPASFTQYILKFDMAKPTELPMTKIEMACYLMAKDAGIQMMPSKLIEINGKHHFLTERFDRVDGRKMHTQTLAAMSSLADSYEDLFIVGRRIGLTAEEQVQQYRRMVFNVLMGNVDDHSKNFSFLMTQDGKWHLSPAYDMLFSADLDTSFFRNHELTINGKRKGFSKKDLMDFANRQDIRNASNIIDDISSVVADFGKYADAVGIDPVWSRKIENVLHELEL